MLRRAAASWTSNGGAHRQVNRLPNRPFSYKDREQIVKHIIVCRNVGAARSELVHQVRRPYDAQHQQYSFAQTMTGDFCFYYETVVALLSVDRIQTS
jgi:hypothetical protein